MRHPFMIAVADELAALGIATLRYQFPFAERQGKRPDPPQLAQATVRAAIAAARETAPRLPLIAGGKSFGGAGAYEKLVGRVHFALDPKLAEEILRRKLAMFQTADIVWSRILPETEGLSQAELVRASEEAAKKAVLGGSTRITTEGLTGALDERKAASR